MVPDQVLVKQSGLSWKGPYRSSSFNRQAMGRDTFHYRHMKFSTCQYLTLFFSCLDSKNPRGK